MTLLRRLRAMYQALCCGHPLPGGPFLWWRCQYGCPWCDYMQKWWVSELPRPCGPYRSCQRTLTLD